MRLRWLAVVGQIVAVLVVNVWLGFPLPIGICFGLIALSALLNIALRLRYPASYRLGSWSAFALLSYDVIQLSVLLYVTGGLDNPFCILLMVPLIVSATTQESRPTLALGIRTTTGDAEGEVLERVDAGHVTPEQIAAACAAFTGEIDQLALWAEARSLEKILLDFDQVDLGSETLSAFWAFDEGQGGEAHDASKNGNTGILGKEDQAPKWIVGEGGGAFQFSITLTPLLTKDNQSLEDLRDDLNALLGTRNGAGLVSAEIIDGRLAFVAAPEVSSLNVKASLAKTSTESALVGSNSICPRTNQRSRSLRRVPLPRSRV